MRYLMLFLQGLYSVAGIY